MRGLAGEIDDEKQHPLQPATISADTTITTCKTDAMHRMTMLAVPVDSNRA